MSGLRFADVEDAARSAAAAALAQGPMAAATAAIAAADRLMAEVAAEPGLAEALAGAACRAGCGWCCHQVVGITVAEEEMIVKAVIALPAETRCRIATRQRAAEARLAKLPVAEWQSARVPCPLLEDGACVLHDARPLPCRAVLSADAAICRRWYEGEDVRIPQIAAQRGVYSHAQAGLAQALAAAGIPPGPVALTEALALALE
ncbi:MAG: hypothetical protein HY985_13500 [Magnetospirillum sp.]|nr:hypothetical protein [Magnetospirillum sp.]